MAAAAGLACAACCIVELALAGGLGALSIGVEFSELARLAPLVLLAAAAVTVVGLLRHRRRHTRPPATVALPMPRVRGEVRAIDHTPGRAVDQSPGGAR